MSSYKEYYFSDERQIARGVMAIALGAAACCIPGGQAVGAIGIAKGVAKIAITTAVAVAKDKKNKG